MSGTTRGLVIQSHRKPLPAPWLQACLDSVSGWAELRSLERLFLDDTLFDVLDDELRTACAGRTVVATDLARLAWLQWALDEGHDPVVWLDADVLVFDPESLVLPDEPFAVGREVWVDEHDGRPRARRQVHNAFLMFRPGNAFLGFYRFAAERMVRAHDGPMVPQFVGPKLLTALHNIVRFPVVETVNMLPPIVLRDIVDGGGPFRDAWLARSHDAPAAVNLCGSRIAEGDVTEEQVHRVIDRLLTAHE